MEQCSHVKVFNRKKTNPVQKVKNEPKLDVDHLITFMKEFLKLKAKHERQEKAA